MSNATRSTAPDSASAASGDTAEASSEADVLLELFEAVDAPPSALPDRIQGVVVGRLIALEGGARVAWAGAPRGSAARAMAALDARHVGGEVALLFEEGDPSRPVILGAMEPRVGPPPAEADAGAAPVEEPIDGSSDEAAAAAGPLRIEALADGKRVVVEADRELVLSCGKASITLTRAGKILIRGAYVSSHATGTQRIVGGIVQIN